MTEQQVGTRFVGRDRELRELVDLLDDSRNGRGRVVLLGGEPGIGKSRLASELDARAREQGHLVLWGRGWEGAGAPPYWPWVQAIRAYLRTTDPADVRRHLGSGARDVVQMIPELHDLFPDLEPSTQIESESARFQLFDSTTSWLRNIARDRPLLIVIDDLQAADTPSILFLRFLARALSDIAALVVGTYRDVELTPDHPLTSAIDDVSRESGTRVLVLTGLPAEAVGTFLGVDTDAPARAQLGLAVWRATDGNPLFVTEAVRLLSAEGRLRDVADLPSLRVAVPPGVRAVIARRIGYLSADTGQALTIAAAIGPEFGVEVLRRVGRFDRDNAMDMVDEAVRARLLNEVIGSPGRYHFSHDLVRETLYRELSASQRARMHRQVADALETMYENAIEAHLTELAFHYVEAVRPGDPDEASGEHSRKAVDYARRAGDAAARSLGYEEAARLYRMSLSVLDAASYRDDDARAETLLSLGEIQARVGGLDEARPSFLEAAEIARRRGDGRQLARAALGLGGRLAWARAGKDTKLIPLLQDALVLLGGDDDRLRVLLLARLACAWRSTPDRRNDSDTLSRQAIEIARGMNDLATLSSALSGRFWATSWPENPEEREALADEIIKVAEALGDGERIIDAHLVRFMSLGELGRLAEARLEISSLVRSVEELRQPAQAWLVPVNRAYLALVQGEFELAEELIDRQLQPGYQVTPGRDDVSAARTHRFLLRREQGRVAEEEATVRASVEDFPWYPFHRAALACLLTDLGRDAEARAVFEELAANDFQVLYRDNEWLFGMSLTSEACARLGDSERAAILYAELEPFAGRHAIGLADGSAGVVDRYLGLLAATRGDTDAAVGHLEEAIVANERMGARPWAAHSRHDLAEVLRRRSSGHDRERADQLDAEARRAASNMGMALADQIASEPQILAEAGGPSEATFRREGEYWHVVFGDDSFRIRDSRGMRHLAQLLERPGNEIHALELASVDAPEARPSNSPVDRAGPTRAERDVGPLLDAEAKAAYAARLSEIDADLDEAQRWNDPERVVRLEAERDAIAQELAGAFGLGGRSRTSGSPTERARVSVTRAIRVAMGRIAEQSNALGDHLDATVRTGTFCSYTPDPRAPITWRT